MRASRVRFQKRLDGLSSASNLSRAAKPLKAMGLELGLARPSVVDDYANNGLLAVEDGRLLAEIFGWEDFVDKAVEKLGASNRTRAVAIAAQLGLIHAPGLTHRLRNRRPPQALAAIGPHRGGA